MELDIVARSAGPDVENGGTEVAPGDPRRWGIAMPRPPTVGDESGRIRRGWNGGDWYRREKSRGLEIAVVKRIPGIRKYVMDLIWVTEERG